MGRQKKLQVLALMTALLLLLSACGGNTQPPVSVAPEEEKSAQTPVLPEAPPAEENSPFCTVNGLPYRSELGEPILGEKAAELADSVPLSAAAEQITNVGDAICYLRAVEEFDQPYDTCTLFAELIAGDYDEVGRILFSRHDNGYCLLYVRQDEVFYPLDPFMFAKGSSGWFYDDAYEYTSAETLEALCEELRVTFPYNGENNPMTLWEVKTLSTKAAQEEKATEPAPQTPETPQSKFAVRKYTDEELQAFVEADLSFEEACNTLSTVSDAVQYLYLRGYHFAPDDAGTEASTRYRLNSGACVGGSALFNALLEGDYDAQGYVYIFYARGEHVFNYYVLDGVYYFCDFVMVFHDSGVRLDVSPVCYMTTDPSTIYEAWLEMEPHDLNDSTSDMYLAAMYTTAYHGNPTMPRIWLRDSDSGKYSHVPLSEAEKTSQKILFIRDGFTFEF